MKLSATIILLSSLCDAALRSKRVLSSEARRKVETADGDLTCPDDKHECPDGTMVERDPYYDCEFHECPPYCPPDTKECPDGTMVERDPYYDCEFYECPLKICDTDLHHCPGGSIVARNPDFNCEFDPCSPVECTDDRKECEDGSTVGRDPEYDCEFFLCPLHHEPYYLAECDDDVRTCEDGTTVGRDPYDNCKMLPCVEDYYEADPCDEADCKVMSQTCEIDRYGKAVCVDLVCAQDVQECPSGDYVSRNPKNGCNFDACPPGTCEQDFKQCPGGRKVGRDPLRGCDFYPCLDYKGSGFTFGGGSGGSTFGELLGDRTFGSGSLSLENAQSTFSSGFKNVFSNFSGLSPRMIHGSCDKKVCSLPADPGPCRAMIPSYYYHQESGKCAEFSYGGCHGNANNFERKEDCVALCSGCAAGGW
mmetsp:Transcript_12406/g.19093  ORF Transcript_12406/g.19093 Transcript_12406/m.19093 type:complete len:420 (-) Transcript_12406:295-1554(-)